MKKRLSRRPPRIGAISEHLDNLFRAVGRDAAVDAELETVIRDQRELACRLLSIEESLRAYKPSAATQAAVLSLQEHSTNRRRSTLRSR
jgi:hypothetical protein